MPVRHGSLVIDTQEVVGRFVFFLRGIRIASISKDTKSYPYRLIPEQLASSLGKVVPTSRQSSKICRPGKKRNATLGSSAGRRQMFESSWPD